MKIKFPVQILAVCAVLIIVLPGCKMKASTETVPEAEGSGKKAVNIHLETMSKDEIKQAADKAIDKTAEAAGQLKEAATTAAGDLKVMATNLTTLTSTMMNIHRANEARNADAQTTR